MIEQKLETGTLEEKTVCKPVITIQLVNPQMHFMKNGCWCKRCGRLTEHVGRVNPKCTICGSELAAKGKAYREVHRDELAAKKKRAWSERHRMEGEPRTG